MAKLILYANLAPKKPLEIVQTTRTRRKISGTGDKERGSG